VRFLTWGRTLNLLRRGWRMLIWNRTLTQLRSGWQMLIFGLLYCAFLLLFRAAFGPVTSATPMLELVRYLVSVPAILAISAGCAIFLSHQPVASVGFTVRPGWWQQFLWGCLSAGVLMGGIGVLEYALGVVRFEWNAGLVPYRLALITLGFVAAAAEEELLCRGSPLQTLARSWVPVRAAAVMSILFAVMHLENRGTSGLAFFNTALAGMWLSVAWWRTGALWLPFGLHLGWNLVQNCAGLAVSGQVHPETMLLTAHATGSEWLTGGVYGPEASLLGTAALLLGLVWEMQRFPGRTPAPAAVEAA
jgi:hypothetical protein